MTWPSPITVGSGWLRAQEESKIFPVRQFTPVYWTKSSWPFFTTAPLPLIKVLTAKVTAPKTLQVKALIKGSGAVVKKGQNLAVQYTGVIWRTGKVFDSSWSRNMPLTTVIGEGQVIKGWDTGLVGQTVGSRVLLVIPPADGYGSAGASTAGIKGTDTLVFVVDILAAV